MYRSLVITGIAITYLVSAWFGGCISVTFSLILLIVGLTLLFPRTIRLLGILCIVCALAQLRFAWFVQAHPLIPPEKKTYEGIVYARQNQTEKNVTLYIRTVDGQYSVTAPALSEAVPGDTVTFDCRPQTVTRPEQLMKQKLQGGCFTYTVQKVGKSKLTFSRMVWLTRVFIRERFMTVIRNPYAAFVQGLLIGGSDGLPADMIANFRNTGTMHMLAVSGYNITIVVALIATLCERLFRSKRNKTIATIIFLALFLCIAGFSPSVIRAGIMGAGAVLVSVQGKYVNRRLFVLYTAVIMTILSPMILRYDIGFQLSFVATLSLLFFLPAVTVVWRKISRSRTSMLIADAILPSLCAYVATLPISLFYFHAASVFSPLVNCIVSPLIPFAMLLGSIACVVSWIPGLGLIVGWCAEVFARLIDSVIRFFAERTTPMQLEISPIFIIAVYAILILIPLAIWRYRLHNRKNTSTTA